MVLCFTIGVALYPIGALVVYTRADLYRRISYTYDGVFQANLTLGTPTARLALGNCVYVEVEDQRYPNLAPVTLRIRNSTDHAVANLTSFGRTQARELSSVRLTLATEAPYWLEVERESQDTWFWCYVRAHGGIMFAASYMDVTFAVVALLGIVLILFGAVETNKLVELTKSYTAV